MKKLLILAFIAISVANAWEIKEVLDSEGTQTNLIKCDNGNIKAIYYNSKNGKYEVTPTIKFDSLDEAAEYVCKK
jgi:hypothetical protein